MSPSCSRLNEPMSSAYIPLHLRQLVSRQSRGRCGYCLSSELITGIPLDLDHLIPTSLGGLTVEENLWSACSRCNGHKGNRVAARDPMSGEIVPLFNPRTQIWNEHFAWTDSDTRILGKTAIGRATVVALRLNRSPLVNARRAWVSVGWHPPEG